MARVFLEDEVGLLSKRRQLSLDEQYDLGQVHEGRD
jgi:hypothetical protein